MRKMYIVSKESVEGDDFSVGALWAVGQVAFVAYLNDQENNVVRVFNDCPEDGYLGDCPLFAYTHSWNLPYALAIPKKSLKDILT